MLYHIDWNNNYNQNHELNLTHDTSIDLNIELDYILLILKCKLRSSKIANLNIRQMRENFWVLDKA